MCTGMHCHAGEVTLEILGEYYSIGDTVYFAITNGLSDIAAFGHDPIYEIRDSSGTEVYPGIHVEWVVYFEPGHSEAFVWTQEHAGGWQVSEGMYYITATWFVEGGPPELGGTLADTLWITEMSGVEPPPCFSWGRVKSLFK
jgi:hypothetical protein